jgi:hypothetical protein
MFILDGKPLSPDVAFTDPATGVQVPRQLAPSEHAGREGGHRHHRAGRPACVGSALLRGATRKMAS